MRPYLRTTYRIIGWKDIFYYKAIGRSVLNYSAPICASTIVNTTWNHLQTRRNIAICTITGYVKKSDINDLHNEGEMMPVKAHREMIAEQFLACTYQSHRVDHKTTFSTSFRPMRPTLNDTHRDRLKQQTSNKEQLNRKEYKNALRIIHQHTVHTQLNQDSKQLGTPPPNIAKQNLPRIARIRLAQLGTGYCPC